MSSATREVQADCSLFETEPVGMAAKNGGSDGVVSKYETEEGLREVAAFLRGRNGMPLRPAIEVDKRVEYFKGKGREAKACSLV